MNIEFKNNYIYDNLKDIYITQDGKTLKIIYGGNGDLYIDIFGEYSINELGVNNATFCIKKDSDLYYCFDSLLNSILNCQVYNIDEELEISTFSGSKYLNEKLKRMNANRELVHNGIVEWYSDSVYDEKANLLKIEKIDEEIVLTFYDNPKDPIFGFGIRICNSGSKYDPFNICFMNLFNKFQEIAKSKTKIKKISY